MAAIGVRNGSNGWLVLWIEPIGEDRWLMPGETFEVRSDYVGDEQAFTVDYSIDHSERGAGIESITVYTDKGDWQVEVTDGSGNLVHCGHQRPSEIDQKWKTQAEEARRRMQDRLRSDEDS